jgi:hypothetical protein
VASPVELAAQIRLTCLIDERCQLLFGTTTAFLASNSPSWESLPNRGKLGLLYITCWDVAGAGWVPAAWPLAGVRARS